MQPQRDAHLTELVFLDRGPIALRCIAVVIAAAACGVAGTLLVRLHQSLAGELAAHDALNPLQTLIATGSTTRTLWPGWVAALCFGAAVLRLRHGATEPPPGRTAVEHQTLAQLRSGLRREYRVVRTALVVVVLCAAVDVARTIASLIAAQAGDKGIASTHAGDGRRGARVRGGCAGPCGVGTQLRHRGAPPRRVVTGQIRRSTT